MNITITCPVASIKIINKNERQLPVSFTFQTLTRTPPARYHVIDRHVSRMTDLLDETLPLSRTSLLMDVEWTSSGEVDLLMEGRMDGWMDERKIGWMERWMDESVVGQINE